MPVLIRFKFAKRAFTLPFFNVLEPSKKSIEAPGKRHKTTLDESVQMVRQDDLPWEQVETMGYEGKKVTIQILFFMEESKEDFLTLKF